jgi:hypothetical protein
MFLIAGKRTILRLLMLDYSRGHLLSTAVYPDRQGNSQADDLTNNQIDENRWSFFFLSSLGKIQKKSLSLPSGSFSMIT